MIESAEQLFKAAPRKEGFFIVNGEEIKVIELSVLDRLEFSEFCKEFPKDKDLAFSFLLSRACPLLKGKTPADIKDRLSPEVLTAGGLEVLALSGVFQEKKPLAESEDSSTD